ncbi:MAG: amino acid permease [Chloroflexota bacterium]|nr:MAG: amino acid permease [Chloroflexota bacterium]
MADKPTTNDSEANVRFSPFMRLSTAVALGSLATVGLGVYLLVSSILKNLGQQTPLAYGLAVLFFAPVVLVLAERAAVMRGRGGIFNLARSGDVVWLSYWTGWLLVLGYICLAALFAWGAGQILNTALRDYLEIEVDYRLLAALALLLVVFLRQIRRESAWNLKRGLIYGSILVVLILTVRLWVRPVQVTPTSGFLPTQDPISAIPFLAIGMWGVSFILDHRNEMRSPRRRMLAALSLPLLIGGAIGIITSFILLQYTGVVATSDQPLIALVSEIGPVAEGLILLASLGLALAGINQSLESTSRLLKEMVGIGFFTDRLLVVKGKTQPYLTIAIPLTIVIMVVLLQVGTIAGAAAATLLLAISLAVGQDIFRRNPYLPDNRRLKLPLHPLFPAVAAAVSLAMAFAQPPENELLVLAWAVLGLIYYSVRGRRGAIEARQRGTVVSGEPFDHERATGAILVHVPDARRAQPLISAGALMARTRKIPLLVLQVIETAGPSSQAGELSDTQRALSLQEQLLADSRLEDIEDIQVIPLVRLAPTAHQGIMATIWDEQVATAIVSWPVSEDEQAGLTEDEVSRLVRQAPCEIVVVRGEFPAAINDVLVPMTSVSHNQAALAFGRDLVRGSGGRVRALGIIRGRASDEAKNKAREAILTTVNRLDDTVDIEIEIVELVSAQEDFYRAIGQYDLMILGASDEGFLRLTSFEGFPADTIAGADRPGIVIKKRERTGALWVRQIWEALFRILPKVGRQDRVSIYRSMQRNARADIDFQVLIILAAGIAYLGLLLNSSSVIIGAMLIAPLMSPILSTAHGIVMGNGRMTRAAGNSTLNGVILAVFVAFFLSLTLFAVGAPLTATDEILSRTSPNVLDLLVALLSGAAAAYAVSRSQLAAALPGVAIAAALVPPLCVVGYGLGTGQFDIALGSSLLFITNLAAIIVAAAAIFLLLGFRPPLRLERGQEARRGLYLALTLLLVVAAILVIVTLVTNEQAKDVAAIESIITTSVTPDEGEVIDLEIDRHIRQYNVSYTIVDYIGDYSDTDVDALQREIDAAVSQSVLLHASILRGDLTVSDGSERPTPTESPTPTLAATETATFTPNPTMTATPTPEPTASSTPVPEATPTEAVTEEPTEEPPTAQPTQAPTATDEPATATAQPTEEPSPTVAPTEEPTPESAGG